jgi:O-acetyl-ADP-ribose deacetylase (regulator of RNase III)
MQVHVVKSPLLELPVDAIVVPANSTALMNEGLALEVRERAGPEVELEAVECAPIAVGAAVVTGGGALHAHHIIHAPTVEEPWDRLAIESVRRATRAALLATVAHGFRVVAFPPMGAGPGALTVEEIARAMVDELRAHRQTWPETVYLADASDSVVLAFENALRALE